MQLPVNGSPIDVDSVGNLLAPLDPRKAIYLEQIISYRGPASPQGSRLVSSLLSGTASLWRMQNNLPITLDRTLSFPPFQKFSHQYLPSRIRNAKLTPWKLGIVYCWAIHGSIRHKAYPGNITALIYDSQSKGVLKAFLGRLVVLDTTVQTSTVDSDSLQSVVGSLNVMTNDTLITSGTLTQPLSDAGTITILQDTAYLERSYLDSIASTFFKCVVHPSYEKVSNTYNDTVLHQLNHFDKSIEARLSIYRGAETHALTWDRIVEIIIQLSVTFANRQGPPAPKFAQIQIEGGEALARIEVGPVVGVATS